jgi:hypothetical protein
MILGSAGSREIVPADWRVRVDTAGEADVPRRSSHIHDWSAPESGVTAYSVVLRVRALRHVLVVENVLRAARHPAFNVGSSLGSAERPLTVRECAFLDPCFEAGARLDAGFL